MKTYHKIQTVYKRDPATKFTTLLYGEYSLPEFKYLEDCQWEFTEKVDGTNIRVRVHPSEVLPITFRGKSDDSQIPKPLEAALEEMFVRDQVRNQLVREIFGSAEACIYGEGYGERIQKAGKLYLKNSQSFVVFDIAVDGLWLRRGDVLDVCKKLGLQAVPTRFWGTLSDMVKMCQRGFDSCWGDFCAEGLVGRPTTELFSRRGERIITKLKCKDFRT